MVTRAIEIILRSVNLLGTQKVLKTMVASGYYL